MASGTHRKTRVLVVDDEADLRELFAVVLGEHLGVRVDVAESGAAALAACRESMPAVVLVDMRLPDMTGPEVAMAIRDLPHGAHVRIFAVSGSDDDSDLRTARAAGIERYLVKPADLDELTAAVRAALLAS